MEDAANRISLLMAWRRGAVSAAVCSGALLATGVIGLIRALVGFGSALCVMGGVETALRCFLRECTLHPELAQIAAVARYRERLCSARSRCRLATWLRSTVRDSHAARSSPYVLWHRVALVSDELLALADELESADAVDPRTMIEIKRLLCDGQDSPLLNERLPAAAAGSAILSARFRVITAPLQDSVGRSADPVAHVPASQTRRRTSRSSRSGPSAD